MFVLIVMLVFSTIFFGSFLLWVQRYKRCPPDKILVVYGKTQGVRSSTCIHGGACFVWPVIQSHQWLDLAPIPVDLGEKEFSPTQKHRVKIVSKLIAGISTQSGIMENAAERLLGLNISAIRDLAFKIKEGSMRSVVKELGAEAIQSDPDSLVDRLGERLNLVFKDIGLKVIHLDIVKIEVSLPDSSSFESVLPDDTPSTPSFPDLTLAEKDPVDPSESNPSSTHNLS